MLSLVLVLLHNWCIHLRAGRLLQVQASMQRLTKLSEHLADGRSYHILPLYHLWMSNHPNNFLCNAPKAHLVTKKTHRAIKPKLKGKTQPKNRLWFIGVITWCTYTQNEIGSCGGDKGKWGERPWKSGRRGAG